MHGTLGSIPNTQHHEQKERNPKLSSFGSDMKCLKMLIDQIYGDYSYENSENLDKKILYPFVILLLKQSSFAYLQLSL